jgi:hypothetical protein
MVGDVYTSDFGTDDGMNLDAGGVQMCRPERNVALL